MRKAKNLKKCMALVLAMMMLIGVNPVNAFAATRYNIDWDTDESYKPTGVWMYVDYFVETGGIATHEESFLSSVYDLAGVISTAERVTIIDVGAENHYSWGTLSGTLSISVSKVGALSGSIGVSGKDAQGNVSSSIESGATSVSFSCAKNSESTLSASVSAVGILSCDLMLSYYANCYDENTHRVVDNHSDSETWDLHEELDYR